MTDQLTQKIGEKVDVLFEAFRKEEIYLTVESERVGWKLHAQNPDIDYVVPESGAMAWMNTFAIPSRCENLDALPINTSTVPFFL